MILNLRLLALISVAAAGLSAEAFGGDTPTACERSAEKMADACHSDVAATYFETNAKCKHVEGVDGRAGCNEAANEDRSDLNEECREVRHARLDACDLLDERRYTPDPLANRESFIDPDEIPSVYSPNPYISLQAGHTFVLSAGDGEETIVVYTTDRVRKILGVPCRVIVDIVVETSIEHGQAEYEAVEVTDDWMAQRSNGDVIYCGELARNYEDGVLRDLDGSFEAGMEYAKSGVLFLHDPVWGLAHRQEFALGVAEDILQYLDLATAPTRAEGGDNPAFPCRPNRCVKAMEFAPLEPDSSEYKYYLPGTGFVLAVDLEDGEITGDREELVCVGDSLDILGDPACAIDDAEALLEELCSLSPETFCPD